METDGLIPRSANKPVYYVCTCQQGYITSSNCDSKVSSRDTRFDVVVFFDELALLQTAIPAAASRCGPNGKTYPSRNPNNPIGCWCNNGTHIEEIEVNGPTQYCLWIHNTRTSAEKYLSSIYFLSLFLWLSKNTTISKLIIDTKKEWSIAMFSHPSAFIWYLANVSQSIYRNDCWTRVVWDLCQSFSHSRSQRPLIRYLSIDYSRCKHREPSRQARDWAGRRLLRSSMVR